MRRAAAAVALGLVLSALPTSSGAISPGFPIAKIRGGIAQFRASNGRFLSYSEPHISVDPLNPEHVVAASKMFQNLERYRFKIGTFVSFNGGRTWRDNGMLPGYPKQTGDEDDYYLTSDPWTAFDDEGNAYVMLLDDDDTTDSRTGAGYGMSLHRSADGGRTWSKRIAIHRNDDPVSNNLFLDDKDALVIDNYGPDRDGRTGPMYACWDFDALPSIQSIVVARSTDGGRTWGIPLPVSEVKSAVIGCALAVGPPRSPGEPGPLYAFWTDFLDPLSPTGVSVRMAVSTNGGQTFGLPSRIATVRPIPGRLGSSQFRNLTLPAVGVDPKRGTLYVAWADYHTRVPSEPCPEEGGADFQVCDADILLTRSSDGGRTWSAPSRVNRDRVSNGKDQFQPALAVTPRGQLDMMWFDRRNDPFNYYIDTYVSRSNDGGRHWKETRVTRSLWDPSVNPPSDGSSDFIGDYQGIAATDRMAIPFWNDTSLANLNPSDRRYSPYQQVFSARVPNTPAFGGPK